MIKEKIKKVETIININDFKSIFKLIGNQNIDSKNIIKKRNPIEIDRVVQKRNKKSFFNFLN
tara:strand:- start:283 stop:468 length:186 start_codon:yes stop_codon:yes gene_type:complete